MSFIEIFTLFESFIANIDGEDGLLLAQSKKFYLLFVPTESILQVTSTIEAKGIQQVTTTSEISELIAKFDSHINELSQGVAVHEKIY